MELSNSKIQEGTQELKNALKMIGFTQNEIELQSQKLGELILKSIIIKLLQTKKVGQINVSNNPKVLDEFIKNNFSKDELQEIVTKESQRIVGEYLQAITK